MNGARIIKSLPVYFRFHNIEMCSVFLRNTYWGCSGLLPCCPACFTPIATTVYSSAETIFETFRRNTFQREERNSKNVDLSTEDGPFSASDGLLCDRGVPQGSGCYPASFCWLWPLGDSTAAGGEKDTHEAASAPPTPAHRVDTLCHPQLCEGRFPLGRGWAGRNPPPLAEGRAPTAAQPREGVLQIDAGLDAARRDPKPEPGSASGLRRRLLIAMEQVVAPSCLPRHGRAANRRGRVAAAPPAPHGGGQRIAVNGGGLGRRAAAAAVVVVPAEFQEHDWCGEGWPGGGQVRDGVVCRPDRTMA